MKKQPVLASVFAASLAAANVLADAYPAEQPRPHWEWAGWGGGGYFWSVAADPVNPDIFYLGGDVLGVYKSENGGRSWRIVNDGIQNYGVYTLAVAPSDSKTVYAMTEDGIARSRDGAETWTPLATTRNNGLRLSVQRGSTVRSIAVDPRSANTLYAGSGKGVFCKSTDGGETWDRIDLLAALSKANAPQGPKAPSGNSFLWFGVDFANGDWAKHARLERFLSESGENWSKYKAMTAKVYLPAGNARMFGSLVIQSGAGWTWVETPFKELRPGEWTELSLDFSKVTDPASCKLVHLVIRRNQNEAFKGEIGVDAVTLVPKADTDKPLLLGDWETKDLDGWRKSAAKDAVFSKATRSSRSEAEPENGPIGTVLVSAANPNQVFVAHTKHGLFRSADAGATWTHLAALPKSATTIAGGWKKDPNVFYAGFAKNGVYRSADAGLTWTKLASVPANLSAKEIAVDPRSAETVHLLCTEGWGGTYLVSHDAGATWTQRKQFTRDVVGNPTLPDEAKGANPQGNLSAATNLGMSPADPDRLVISANWCNLVSHDGGDSWTEASRGADITCFHDLRFAGGSVYGVAMDEGIFRSDDNGKTWKQLLPKRWTPGLSGHQWRVCPQVLADGRVRVVTTVAAWRHNTEFPPQVYVSEDNGDTFVKAQGLPDYLPKANTMWGEGFARALCADPKNPDVMYLGIDGDPENGKSGGGVFKSVDGGKNWKQLESQPGSRRMFYGIAVDPTDSNRIFWGACGATSGVYMSEDAGASWVKTSCPPEWFFNLDITPSGTVLAGGGNLWISRDHGKTWTKSTNFSGLNICGIAYDPANENRLWVSAVNWGGSSTGGIYESVDGGKTWTDITGDCGYRRPLVLRYNPDTKQLWAAGVGAFRLQR